MKKLVVLSLCFKLVFVFSQSGYLGSLNSFQLNYSAVPSLKVKNKLNSEGNLQQNRKILNSFYGFEFSRVLSSNFELSFSYNYSNVSLNNQYRIFSLGEPMAVRSYYIADGEFIEQNNNLSDNNMILNEARFRHHAFGLNFKFYRKGSLAPIGKFINLSISRGISNINGNDRFVIGNVFEPIYSNWMKEISEINESIETTYLIDNVKSVHLRLGFGRNKPVSNNLIIGYVVDIPFINVYTSGSRIKAAMYSWNHSSRLTTSADSNISYFNLTYKSINNYYGLRVNFNIKYVF